MEHKRAIIQKNFPCVEARGYDWAKDKSSLLKTQYILEFS